MVACACHTHSLLFASLYIMTDNILARDADIAAAVGTTHCAHRRLVVLNGTKHIRLQDPSTATLMETAPEVDKVNEDGSTTTKGARQSSSIFAKRNKRRRHPQHTNGGGHGGGVDDDGDTGSASSGKGGAVELPFIDVVVGRGEALYIPAGWFHEVRSEPPSMDDDGCARDGDGRGGGGGGGGDIGAATPHHAAINFWFVRE